MISVLGRHGYGPGLHHLSAGYFLITDETTIGGGGGFIFGFKRMATPL